MRRLLLTIILGTAFATAAWAQDSGEENDAPDAAEEEAEPVSEPVSEQVDDSDLDDQTYADSEDDDFRPSEDIPADQSIPFPTDI